MIFLPKYKDDCCALEDCRPISIIQPIQKILDKAVDLTMKEETWKKEDKKISDEQTGFQENCGCDINIKRVLGEIKRRLKIGEKKKKL